jgi:hypothetical protein
MKTSKLLFLGLLIAALALPAIAQLPQPATCNSIGIGISLKSVVGGSTTLGPVYQGDLITYRVSVSVPSDQDNCDVIGGQLSVTFPDGTVVPLAGFPSTPVITQFGDGSPYQIDCPITYPADSADLSTGLLKARADYGATTFEPTQTNGTFLTDPVQVTASATTSNQLAMIAPSTDVGISASDNGICAGSTVDLEITEENDGDADLFPAGVDLFKNDAYWMTLLVGDLEIGEDIDDDGVLSSGETWTWNLPGVVVGVNTTFKAIGHGIDRFLNDVTYCESAPPANTICNENEKAETTVTVYEAPTCSIGGLSPVCAGTTGHVYSGPASMTVYTWSIIDGDATIPGATHLQDVTVNAGSTSFTLQLYIEDSSGCSATCTEVVTVNPNPTCTISEPLTVPDCPSTGNTLEVVASGGTGPYTYDWSIIGDIGWAITSATNIVMITYDTGSSGCATFEVEVTDSAGCKTTCELRICCTGDTYCSFTQGFWGNAGGTKCDPSVTTTELLIALLNAADAASVGTIPVVVGIEGERSIKFETANSILLRLPCGGKPSALPAVNLLATDKDGLFDAKLLKKKEDRINNVLVGQVVALTLNLRVSPGCLLPEGTSGVLANWPLEAEFCTVPYDDPEACPEPSTIPESLAGDSMDVEDLLLAANQMLAGTYAGDASIGDIYNAVTAINEGFDECRSIVPCPGDFCTIPACWDMYDCD